MSMTNNSDYNQVWEDYSTNLRTRLRQTEITDRDTLNSSTGNTTLSDFDRREPPRSNPRVRRDTNFIQYGVSLANDSSDLFSYRLILAWTCATSDFKRGFKIELPHRKNIKNYQAIPIIPFQHYPLSTINKDKVILNQLENIPDRTHRWLIPDTIPELNNYNLQVPLLDYLVEVIAGNLRKNKVSENRINDILGDNIPEYKILTCSNRVIDLPWDPIYPNIDNICFDYCFSDRQHTIKWVDHGTMVWPFVTLLSITTSPNIKVDSIRSAIEVIPDVVIFDIWKNTSTSRNNQNPRPYLFRPTGKWFISIGTLQNPQLPGYVKVDGVEQGCILSYEGRKNWCNYCKSCNADDFHERANCPRLDCHHCGKKGSHKPNECPYKSNKPTNQLPNKPINQLPPLRFH